MSESDLLDWWCDGQTDLTDGLDVEHIPGGMPADPEEREAHRQAYYAQLPDVCTDSSADYQGEL